MAAPLGGTTGRGPRRPRGPDGNAVDAIGRFPDDNPNAVMRCDSDGLLIYANRSSQPILASLGTDVGEPLSRDLLDRSAAVVPRRGSVELVAASRTYALWPVHLRCERRGLINVKGVGRTPTWLLVGRAPSAGSPASSPSPA